MADDIRTTIVVARKTSALRTQKSLVGKSFDDKDKAIDTSKLKACAKAFANRQNSPLLQLPAEMRNRIYAMVLQAGSILIRSRYLTAFDMTVALRSCCSSTSPTHLQTWSEGSSLTLLPIICRQLYEETRGLLYALNTFAFIDEQSMRVWFSCRKRSQRHQVRSLKLPSAVADYYRSPHNISLAAVYPQLKTIYIDLWRVVEMENEIDDTSEEDVVRLLAEEKVKAQKREEGDVKIVATEYVYTPTVIGSFLQAA